MSDPQNPYKAPTGPLSAGAATPGSQNLRGIASSQRGVMICILLYFLVMIGQLTISEALRPFIAGLALICVGIASMTFVFMLSTKLYSTGVGVLLGLLTLIPCFGLLVLLIINGKATKILKENGIPVGLLGANMSSVPE